MISSKFKWNALLPLIPAGVVLWILYELRTVILPLNQQPFVVYPTLGLFVFILVWVVFGELRTKAIKLTIEGDQITAKNFFGLGLPKKYYFNQITGFKISILPTTNNSYEFLYLIVKNRKVIKISAFYHSNYSRMKEYIITKFPDLGYEDFSLFGELKEIFI